MADQRPPRRPRRDTPADLLLRPGDFGVKPAA